MCNYISKNNAAGGGKRYLCKKGLNIIQSTFEEKINHFKRGKINSG